MRNENARTEKCWQKWMKKNTLQNEYKSNLHSSSMFHVFTLNVMAVASPISSVAYSVCACVYVIVILYCCRPKIVIAVHSVTATMAGSSAVGIAVANASLQASVLQQYVRVFQTSAKRWHIKCKKKHTHNNNNNEKDRHGGPGRRMILWFHCDTTHHTNATCPVSSWHVNK